MSKEQFEKILGYIKAGQDEGANLEYGGKRIGLFSRLVMIALHEVLLLCI